MLNTIMTICFVAGKSGGHLLPCITQARHIKKAQPNSELYIFSTGNDLDRNIIDKHKQIQHYIPSKLWDVPYGQLYKLPLFACNVAWYFCKSLYKLWHIQPNKVISFGGFNSVPVCLSAKLLGIPFEIYELNVEPGKATNFLSYFTNTIYTCFDETKKHFPKHECIHFDYPIRFTESDKITNTKELQHKYHFSPQRKTIFILGGSQGSTLLNDTFIEALQEHPELIDHIQVIHQTGGSVSEKYAQIYHSYNIPAVTFGYHEKLQDFYNIADFIVSRAGAGTLFEINFFNKPCLCIPHQTANTDHQIKNVLALQAQKPQQFTIIKQDDFSSKLLAQILSSVTSQKHL